MYNCAKLGYSIQAMPFFLVDITGGTVCRNNRRLISTPFIVIAFNWCYPAAKIFVLKLRQRLKSYYKSKWLSSLWPFFEYGTATSFSLGMVVNWLFVLNIKKQHIMLRCYDFWYIGENYIFCKFTMSRD